MLLYLVLTALAATVGSFFFLSENAVLLSLASFLILGSVYVATTATVYSILIALFIIMCFFMLIIIMLQQSKGSLSIHVGQSAQMLFGGSGGQDLFQKITWACGILFMGGSLGLTLYKSHEMKKFSYSSSRMINRRTTQQPAMPAPTPAEEKTAHEVEL